MEAAQNKAFSIAAIAANLAAACFIAGIIIAGVYFFTSPIAAQKSVMLRNNSMKSLVEEADTFNAIPGKADWYEAKASGKTVAYVIPAEAKGYGGKIKLLVAVSPEDKVIGYDVVSHNETPGLGDGTSKDFFKERINGKSLQNLKVVKDPNNKDDVQAITGATISSKAVVSCIKSAVEEVAAYKGGSK